MNHSFSPRTLWKAWLMAGVFLLASTAAWAQAGLEITVLDNASRSPVALHPLAISNPAIGYSQTLRTNAQGKVVLTGLSTSGSYAVEAGETPEFYGFTASGILLRSNQQKSVVIVLLKKADQQLDEVVVSAGSIAKINTVNAEISSELRSEEISSLPIEGRDITRALYRLPNVTQATGFFPEAPNVSINGANSLYTNYLIDGLDNNENFLGGMKFNIPVGLTQNITVLTNNYSAEYGWTGNGIFNITTKSGSNTTQGEAYYISRPGAVIDAASPYLQRDLSGNVVKDGFQRQQFGVAMGGALVKDKTFYFIDLEQTYDLKDNLLTVPELGINETVRGRNNFSYLSAKVDQHWSARFRSSIRANVGLVNIQQQGGGLSGGTTFPSGGYSQDRNSLIIANKNVYLGANFTAETNVQYARFRWNYGKPVNGASVNTTVLGPSEQTLAGLGHPGWVFDDVENTVQVQQKFTFNLGKHLLKAGAGLISSNHLLYGGTNPSGNYTVKLTQDQVNTLRLGGIASASTLRPEDLTVLGNIEVLNYAIELQPKQFGTTQNRFSLYVEDQVALGNRLKATLGLRYDYDNLSKGAASRGDLNNLAPRLNLNYTLNERSSLRGGFGIFYEKVLYAIYSDALQQNTTAADYRRQVEQLVALGLLPADTDVSATLFDGNLTATASQNITYLQGPSAEELLAQRDQVFSGERRILNPNGYANPSTQQFALGYQYQVNENTLFYVDLMHTHSYNLYRLRNLNAPEAYPLEDPTKVVVRTPTEADATRPLPIAYDGTGAYTVVGADTLRAIARNIVMSEAGGESKYWAANVNLVKERGSDNFGYRLSYTLSRLTNNTEDINFRALDANNFDAEWGPSINDRTHVISGLYYYYPIKGLAINLGALIQSGQPINRIPDATVYGTTDLNGDGRSFGDAYVGNSDRHPGEGRNSDRLPWANTFDLGVQYQLALGSKGSKVELRADVFNLLNAENLSGYSNNATQSNQIQVGAASSGLLVRRNAAPPRQFQFGLRYLF